MAKSQISKKLTVDGMSCSGCEVKIQRKLLALDGVKSVKANYSKSIVEVIYDETKISNSKITQIISDLGYGVTNNNHLTKQNEKVNYKQLIAIASGLILLWLVVNRLGAFGIFNNFPEAKAGMSYAAIFVVGLLTSVHCVGMCGGICLSQCISHNAQSCSQRIRPAFLYNFGRVISYTVIGAVVGALGSVISFNGFMRGAVALLAGIFMVIMGLNMLNIFPWLKRFNLKLPNFLTQNTVVQSNTPLFVGLINGLMPCGPLQAMQLYALSTGDPVKGALSMLVFSLGTTPLLFGFGAASSLISRKFTKKMMVASAILVIILGVGMFNTGISMAGYLSVGTKQVKTLSFEPNTIDGYQIVKIDVQPQNYAPIVVKKGIPVKFNLHVEEKNLNGCNNAISIPSYGIEMPLNAGDNIVEFTPTETGVVPYSCWMNMIRSSITVVE